MGENSKKPADTPFKQQRLPAWQPILSPPWVICCFFAVAVIFIPIGALVIVASGKVVEEELRYDDTTCTTTPGQMLPCTRVVSFTVTEKMESPVYMYYKLENFYQNHRRYAKSRSDTQLSGSEVSFGDMDDCAPVRYVGELNDGPSPSNGDLSNLYAPCGLIAWSMFNDSFAVYVNTTADAGCDSDAGAKPAQCDLICDGRLEALAAESTALQCKKNGIAWESDKDKKFQAPYTGNTPQTTYRSSSAGSPGYYDGEAPAAPQYPEGHVLPVQTDEDFMVWMRTASLPTFRKLYRRFPEYTFEPGTVVSIYITDRFPVSSFNGKKFVILSTTTWIGGKNYFLGTAYFVVGCLCFVLAVVFVIKHVMFGRNADDTPTFQSGAVTSERK